MNIIRSLPTLIIAQLVNQDVLEDLDVQVNEDAQVDQVVQVARDGQDALAY